MSDLQKPIFHNETKARAWLESQVWPDGPFCPSCGSTEPTALMGKAHRPGLYQCNECRQQFTVTVGTLFERSKIPLSKWLLATYLLSASKKGMSTRQLSRMLGVSVKSTWFMTHRIREAMRDDLPVGMGSGGGIVEVDETFIGHKRKKKKPRKKGHKGIRGHGHMNSVLSLVDRDTGRARSIVVKDLKAKTIYPIIRQNIHREARLMTDDANHYKKIGREFASHDAVRHNIGEYVKRRDRTIHTNTIEGFFSIFKRGMKGIYQHCGSKHLHRYLSEFDFRYNTRDVSDFERAAKALKGITGKRLTYRRTGLRRASA